jgi:hypothetical protein
MSRIPDELMQRLHDANDAFHHATLKLDDLEQMSTEQRTAAAATLRSAEKLLEDLTDEINKLLAAQSQNASPPS